jgi:hypothetical protein
MRLAALSLFLVIIVPGARAGDATSPTAEKGFVGWTTNGAEVYMMFRSLVSSARPKTDSTGSAKIRPEWLLAPKMATNQVFHHFLPDSLAQVVLTNVLSLTNGREMSVWSVRTHPASWPTNPPTVNWNTNCLIWGLKGLTALSPCWEGEGASGQVPVTALTRRHGYTRGHSMGEDGFRTVYTGKKVWFLASDNTLVQVKVLREVVRTLANSNRDYTLLLFDRDLPASVQPLSVVSARELSGKYPNLGTAPWLVLATEQGGNVNAGLPGFTVNPYKGGDSGSPNLLPMPEELVFLCGSSSSAASPEMQRDIDQLCRLEGLDPGQYELQWFDISKYPSFRK